MPPDNAVGNSKTPGEGPNPRGPWSVEDHDGAPRAARPRRIAWFAFTSLPAWLLVASAVPLAASGSWVVAMGYTFAAAAIAMNVWTSQNVYRRGYHVGALQNILDKAEGRTLDDVYHRPEPHPADPTPLPHALRDEDLTS